MLAFLYGKDLHVNTYLWPFIVSYPLFMRQCFVVCHYVSLTNYGVLQGGNVLQNTGLGVSLVNCKIENILMTVFAANKAHHRNL
jgi:hypothetical protein